LRCCEWSTDDGHEQHHRNDTTYFGHHFRTSFAVNEENRLHRGKNAQTDNACFGFKSTLEIDRRWCLQ
jgi:hypothetical protein